MRDEKVPPWGSPTAPVDGPGGVERWDPLREEPVEIVVEVVVTRREARKAFRSTADMVRFAGPSIVLMSALFPVMPWGSGLALGALLVPWAGSAVAVHGTIGRMVGPARWSITARGVHVDRAGGRGRRPLERRPRRGRRR